jgi:hypothetical protein
MFNLIESVQQVVKPDDEQSIQNKTAHNQLSNADPTIQIFKS